MLAGLIFLDQSQTLPVSSTGAFSKIALSQKFQPCARGWDQALTIARMRRRHASSTREKRAAAPRTGEDRSRRMSRRMWLSFTCARERVLACGVRQGWLEQPKKDENRARPGTRAEARTRAGSVSLPQEIAHAGIGSGARREPAPNRSLKPPCTGSRNA